MDTLRPFRGSIKSRSGVFRFYEACPVAISRNNGACEDIGSDFSIRWKDERERQHHYHPGNGGDWKLLSLFVVSNEMFIKVSVDIFIQLSPTYTGL